MSKVRKTAAASQTAAASPVAVASPTAAARSQDAVRAKAAAKPASTRGSVRPSRPTTKANPFTNATAPPKRERFPTASLRVYAKDLATHALQHLPKLGACNGIDGIRRHLIDHLRFNSVATRRRNANYLVNRFFPGDFPHPDLLQFAAAMAGQHGLGDVLFYLTARAEKLVALAADEVVFPALTLGGVSRQKIRDFVQTQLPGSKSAKQVGGAIVATYQKFGVATATRTKLQVCLREGSLPAFAYLLHLEFPEPAMVSFERLLDGPMHRWLLWDREWMVRQLYLLREAGLLSKVSEIDRMRQFTTKLSLAHAVPAIVALTREVAP